MSCGVSLFRSHVVLSSMTERPRPNSIICCCRWPLPDHEIGVDSLGWTPHLVRGPGPWNCCLDIINYRALREPYNREHLDQCEANNHTALGLLEKMAYLNLMQERYERELLKQKQIMESLSGKLDGIMMLRVATATELRRLESGSRDELHSANRLYQSLNPTPEPSSASGSRSRSPELRLD